jgi:hypothetical protein
VCAVGSGRRREEAEHVEFGLVGPPFQNEKSVGAGWAADAAQRSMDAVAAPGREPWPRLIGDTGFGCGDSANVEEEDDEEDDEERTKRHAPGMVLRLGGLPSLSCCSCCRSVGSSKLQRRNQHATNALAARRPRS